MSRRVRARVVASVVGILFGVVGFLWVDGAFAGPLDPEGFAATATNPDRAAATAERACRWQLARVRLNCYGPLVVALVAPPRGAPFALDFIDALGRRDPIADGKGHELTHLVGMAGWDAQHDLANLVAECRPIHQAGCYHGAIQASLRDGPTVTEEIVSSLCDRAAGNAPPPWFAFQCYHGLGHGLVSLRQGDLPQGLAACDWLQTPWSRTVCYAGAFMENIGGSHAGSHGGAHDHSVPTTWRRAVPTDPLYPCSVLPDRYSFACYQTQGALILEGNGVDFGAAAVICTALAAPNREACLTGLGVSVNASASGNPDLARTTCTSWPEGTETWCLAGIARNLVDVHADPIPGVRFCDEISAMSARVSCFQAVGEEARVFVPDSAARISRCDGAHLAHQTECRSALGDSTDPAPTPNATPRPSP